MFILVFRRKPATSHYKKKQTTCRFGLIILLIHRKEFISTSIPSFCISRSWFYIHQTKIYTPSTILRSTSPPIPLLQLFFSHRTRRSFASPRPAWCQDPVESVSAVPGLLAGAAVASGLVHLEPPAGCGENRRIFWRSCLVPSRNMGNMMGNYEGYGLVLMGKII